MHRKHVPGILAAAILLLLLMAVDCFAVPATINYQGRLTDADGKAVADGPVLMTFAVYASESGGTPLWSEPQAVDVKDGVFNVQLGSAIPFPADLFYGDRWLGTKIGTGSEMTPRHLLSSVPYAIEAAYTESLGGYTSSDFALAFHDHDDRYYTETETDTLVSTAVTGHEHPGEAITSGIVADQFIDPAITRDTELTTGLATKADTDHNHFGSALPVSPTDSSSIQNYIDTGLAGKANTHPHEGDTIPMSLTNSTTIKTYIDNGLATKTDSGHKHAGADITSGLVGEAHIDAAIARDSELAAHISNANAHTLKNQIEVVDGNNPNHKISYPSGTSLEQIIIDLSTRIIALENQQSIFTYDEGSGTVTINSNLANVKQVVIGTNLIVDGGNVQIRNGAGTTESNNELGNLIVGYNETRGGGTDVRTGSHNIIVGSQNNYSSYGGLVAGKLNTISGAYASVSGGTTNVASGEYASISGGNSNVAFGKESAILGGYSNTAGDPALTDLTLGQAATVSGGSFNISSGQYASVSGGGGWNGSSLGNTAIGVNSSVSGGQLNNASGDSASVSGGRNNNAYGNKSAILGGYNNIAGDPALKDPTIGQAATVSGGNSNTASGLLASVSGGNTNTSSGDFASVSSGYMNEASALSASVSGGNNNKASSNFASVSGGASNRASGYASGISAGRDNTASGSYASVSGGYQNKSWSKYTAILGGQGNKAGDTTDELIGQFSAISGGSFHSITGSNSSISGGSTNTASGDYASVSGGKYNTASGDYSSVSGGGHDSIPSEGNIASGLLSSVSGGRENQAFSHYSSILGGLSNTSGDDTDATHGSGIYATVSGGTFNVAAGTNASVSGGYNNTANASNSSISGGGNNKATGSGASVSSGQYNEATGAYASVSGGKNNKANGDNSSVNGGATNTADGEGSSILGGATNTIDPGHYNATIIGSYNVKSTQSSTIFP